MRTNLALRPVIAITAGLAAAFGLMPQQVMVQARSTSVVPARLIR